MSIVLVSQTKCAQATCYINIEIDPTSTSAVLKMCKMTIREETIHSSFSQSPPTQNEMTSQKSLNVIIQLHIQ